MRRIVLLGVLAVVLIVCLVIYGARNNPFAPVQPNVSYAPLLTNPEVLQNWLPSSSYKYTLAHINDYLQTNHIQVSTLSIKGNVVVDESNGGAYDFTIQLEPQSQTHNISITINNINGVISNSVSIDGQQQGYLVPTQNNNGTQFSGIDSLMSVGITALQAQELQTAFQKFDPSARNVNINASSIVLPAINPNNPSLTSTYGFSVSFDGKNYDAKLNVTGLNEIELFLSVAQTNKQVFDSGLISQN